MLTTAAAVDCHTIMVVFHFLFWSERGRLEKKYEKGGWIRVSYFSEEEMTLENCKEVLFDGLFISFCNFLTKKAGKKFSAFSGK